MGFRVLLRAAPGDFTEAVEALFEEQPIGLSVPPIEAWDDGSLLDGHLEQKSPCIVVNYGATHSATDFERERKIVGDISAKCAENNIPLLHFSSFHVFGRAALEGDLDEAREPSPSDELGKHLLALETLCAQVPHHMIFRLSWLLGNSHNGLLDTFIPKLLNNENVFVSDHDYGNPVSTSFIAALMLAVVQQVLCGAENWGVFHVRSSDQCSEAEFCDALVRLLNSFVEQEVVAPLVAGVDDDRRTLRGNAQLIGERCTNNFGVQLQSWRMGLKTLVKRYLIHHNHIEAE